jgi:hypothetical protein
MCAQSNAYSLAMPKLMRLPALHIGAFVSDEEIFVSLWHDLTAVLIYEMVTASQLSITLNIKNKCI